MKLSSNKPYLLRAVYEWLLDNKVTPHIVISAENPDAKLPQQYVEDGKIVLNISPTAAQNLLIDDDGISFNARFGGKPFSLYAPMGAVLALYANENGEGMMFEAEPNENDLPPEDTPPDGNGSKEKPKSKKHAKKPSKRPTLKVVK